MCIAGGADTLSDAPIRHSKKLRQWMLAFPKAKTTLEKVEMLAQLRPDFLVPDVPGIEEFSSNESMGHSADRLAATFGVSRRDQDDFARRSHTLAMEAKGKGYLTDVLSVKVNINGH